jgi:hypothetical protein
MSKEKAEFDEIGSYFDKDKMPEATSSVTYNLVSKEGYPLLFTVRRNDEAELFELMIDLEEGFITRGYTADKKYGSAKQVPLVTTKEDCPKCGNPLKEFTTKTGKSGLKCSTSGWDFENKTATGCDYIKWNDAPSSSSEPTEAQIRLLKQKNLWEEGMTRSEASAKISSVLGK